MSTHDDGVLHGRDLVSKLTDLIVLDCDAVVAYEHAIDHVDDRSVRRDLEAFRAEHFRHLDAFNRVIVAVGGAPVAPHRDLKGVALEGITMLRSVAGTLSALRAIRMTERITNRTYLRASMLAVAPLAGVVIDQHFSDEQRHLTVIDAHIDRLSRQQLTPPNRVVPVDHDQPQQ